jgi:hypothetical protein
MLKRTAVMTFACLVATLGLYGFDAPGVKPPANVTIAVACPDTGACSVKATWKLHPSFNAATDSVKLAWKENGTTFATRYTKLSSDSVTVTRQAAERTGTVVATVWRMGVSTGSAAVTAPWTVPATIQPPEPVDSLKTQVGALVTPASLGLAAGATTQLCGYAVYSDGSRELVSGTGCS